MHIYNIKKFQTKIRTYIFRSYARTKSFDKKSTCPLTCAKKTKFKAKNKAFYGTRFLTSTMGFGETLRTHIDCVDAPAKFFVGIIWQSEICFFGGMSICTREPN
jgi:hypothetical protein